MMMLELFFAARESWIKTNKQTKILVDMHFVVKSNFSSLDPVSSKSWLVLQQFTQQKLKVKSETSTFTFLQYELSQPRPERVFKRGLLHSAASCQVLSSHHHWSSAPPSPRAPPRRPMPPSSNPIEWTLWWGLPPVPKPFGSRRNAKGGHHWEPAPPEMSNLESKMGGGPPTRASWCWWWSGGSRWWPTW